MLVLFLKLAAQNPFPEKTRVFDDEILARIDISIETDSLSIIYQDVWSDHEYPADFTFTRGSDVDNFTNIGFRLRGNTSRNSQKKSFKISVNSFEKLKFLGLQKLNINGEHNDPSIIRSKLSWDIFRKFKVIGSRAAHVKMYINNEYYGLYMHIEHIDDQFVDLRYGSQNGNLFKCTWPADLNYISDNPDDYKPVNGTAYELKTNQEADNYADLANFIDVLNNTSDANLPAELEKIFNVNNFLKYLAVEYFIGHWDGYSYNKNNFYLYNNPVSGKFEFIPYDVDNTFGIDWFGTDWSTRNIYAWENPAENRPLTSRLLANQVYLDRFSYYMNQLLDSIAHPDTLFPRIDELKSLITQAAYDDTYRTLDYGWNNADFDNSYTQALGSSHTPIGLKPYISARYNSAKTQLILNNIAPIISNVHNNRPPLNEEININCTVEDELTGPDVTLYYRINGGAEQNITMQANGAGDVNWIGGLNYQANLSALSDNGTVEYYIVASDISAASTREPLIGYHIINISAFEKPPLYINEFMASNNVLVADNNGAYPDWIEIYNGGSETIYLGDKYLSDDFAERQKWQMPDISINAGEFLVFWASGSPENGMMHTNFKLSAGGEEIAIFSEEYFAFSFIDSVSFGEQTTNVSLGRNPDGTGDFTFFGAPTPGASNLSTSIGQLSEDEMRLRFYPNPFQNQLFLRPATSFTGKINVQFISISGRLVHQETKQIANKNEILLDVNHLPKGNYILRLQDLNGQKIMTTSRLIKY